MLGLELVGGIELGPMLLGWAKVDKVPKLAVEALRSRPRSVLMLPESPDGKHGLLVWDPEVVVIEFTPVVPGFTKVVAVSILAFDLLGRRPRSKPAPVDVFEGPPSSDASLMAFRIRS